MRLLEIIDRFKDIKIGVLGDMVADVYLFGKPHKLSREAPVVVIKYEGEEIVPGGGANAVNNLCDLGASVYAFGIVGDDKEGEFLRRSLQKKGVNTDGIVIDEKDKTISKIRILAGDDNTSKQQVVRIDKETNYAKKKVTKKVLEKLDSYLDEIDILLISDYGYFPFGKEFFKILEKFKNRKKMIIVDSHKRYHLFKDSFLITPNEGEAKLITGKSDLISAGKKLLKMLRCQNVLITRGNKGMLLFEKRGILHEIPVFGPKEAVDVTGAGDTVVASMALCLGGGATPLEASVISAIAASIVVMKKGTATSTKDELLFAIRRENGRYSTRSRPFS